MFMNISERFPYPYENVYFTCLYLGRIFLDVYILQSYLFAEMQLLYSVPPADRAERT